MDLKPAPLKAYFTLQRNNITTRRKLLEDLTIKIQRISFCYEKKEQNTSWDLISKEKEIYIRKFYLDHIRTSTYNIFFYFSIAAAFVHLWEIEVFLFT